MENYAHDSGNQYNWMLGRFVLPIAKLDEFEALLPQFALRRWSLSILLSANWKADIERLWGARSEMWRTESEGGSRDRLPGVSSPFAHRN